MVIITNGRITAQCADFGIVPERGFVQDLTKVQEFVESCWTKCFLIYLNLHIIIFLEVYRYYKIFSVNLLPSRNVVLVLDPHT